MITFPLPLSHIYSIRLKDFAYICHVCLKPWLVCGEGKGGFIIERVACSDCAYSQPAWNITGGPSWWRTESSCLSDFESAVNETLTRQPPTIHDILNTLPPHIIEHEFKMHLKAHDWFSQDIEQEQAA